MHPLPPTTFRATAFPEVPDKDIFMIYVVMIECAWLSEIMCTIPGFSQPNLKIILQEL
jgi:hypothetical protein